MGSRILRLGLGLREKIGGLGSRRAGFGVKGWVYLANQVYVPPT